jgi:aminoglycoside phosphotransferase (APT) family kinase protein
MQRAAGEPAMAVLLRPGGRALRVPALIAEAHARLHRLDPSPLRVALTAAGDDPARTSFAGQRAWVERALAERGVGAFREAFAWVDAHAPDERDAAVCHGDFHPGNVLIDGDRVSGVIDWSNVAIADPLYDHTRTLLLWRRPRLDAPAILRFALGGYRRWLHGAYQRRYRAAMSQLFEGADDRVHRWLAANSVLMLASGYLERLRGGDDSWFSRAMADAFGELSGVRPTAGLEGRVRGVMEK